MMAGDSGCSSAAGSQDELVDCGEDTDGRKYKHIDEMWGSELAGEEGRKSWYSGAADYWHAREATVDGVLGGYAETNGPDLRESRRFLELLQKTPGARRFERVLDCGAGIGRVTSGLLMNVFDSVDLVEPNKKLLEAAKAEITDPRAELFINEPLQDVRPQADRYDVIWAQWVLLYLPDDDLLQFLQRCRSAIRPGGFICVKENVVLDGEWMVDKEDNSISRTDEQYKAIFDRAGLSLFRELKQTCWPPDLIPVKMYALKASTDMLRAALKRPASVLKK